MTHPRPAFRPAPPAEPIAFHRDERGAMTVFGVFIFVLMVVSAGMAIDTMRHEEYRVELQYSLDRAVLSAASLEQAGNPEIVVRDFMAAQGYDPSEFTVAVVDRPGLRKVTAQAVHDVPTVFARMLGIDEMSAPARSKAADQKHKVEIAMVLDTSGSMTKTTPSGLSRMEELRPAARAFVNTVLRNEPERLSVSIVPYHAMVNVGSELGEVYELSTEHDATHCARFDLAHYSVDGLPDGAVLDRTAHFDRWGNGGWGGGLGEPECEYGDATAILAWTNDEVALTQRINSLTAKGGTAIHLGMKWADVLTHHSSSDELAELISDGRRSTDHVGRPFNDGAAETAKYVVLMTDGAQDEERDLGDDYKGAAGSGVWVQRDNWPSGGFSTSHGAGDNFDADKKARYYYDVPGRDDSEDIWDEDQNRWIAEVPSDAHELSNAQLFGRLPLKTIADGHLGQLTSWHNGRKWFKANNGLDLPWIGALYERRASDFNSNLDRDHIDDNLSDTCRRLRDRGVTIFTVSFFAKPDGVANLKDCASSPSHHYEADETDIEATFESIAGTITRLGLRQ